LKVSSILFFSTDSKRRALAYLMAARLVFIFILI
jgi:hypothetical protein